MRKKPPIPDDQFAGFEDLLHFNTHLEQVVLGACMLESMAYGKIQGYLTPECFYHERHQIIYRAISELWKANSPIDIILVVDQMVRWGYKDDPIFGGTMAYEVTKLTNTVVSSVSIDTHSLIIREKYIERELIKIKKNSGSLEGDVLDRIAALSQQLEQLAAIRHTSDWSDMGDALMRLHAHMAEVEGREIIGLPLGFRKVDLVTGGLCNGMLIIIGARPSVGKSALLNILVRTQAQAKFKPGIVSLEMPKTQLAARLLSIETGIPFYKIFRNQLPEESERERVYDGMARLEKLTIFISDKTGVNVHDIKAKAAQLIYKHNLDILFIDYLQLVEGVSTDDVNKKFNREQEVAKMTRELKLMAMDFNIPIVCLAQLNRGSETTGDRKPQLHNLRESGAIEQDADMVIFLHRDWKVGITENAETGKSTEFEADLIVAKFRNGQTGSFKIGWSPDRMEFFDLDNPYRPPNLPFIRTRWLPHNED